MAFDPREGTLAWAEGAHLRLLGMEGGERAFELPFAPTALRWGLAGELWALGAEGLGLWREGRIRTFPLAEGADELLGADGEGAWLLTRGWLDGVGAASAIGRLSPRGELQQDPLEPGGPTALALTSEAVWTLRGPRVDGALRARGRVVLSRAPTEGRALAWPVLAEGEEGLGLVARGDRALVVGRSGAWELWVVGDRAPRAAGSERPGAAPVRVGDRVALGRALLSLLDGHLRSDALPAPARAASPDGRRWVLGEGEESELWSAP